MDHMALQNSQINLEIPFADFLLNGGRLDGLDNDNFMCNQTLEVANQSSMTNYCSDFSF